MKAPKDEEYEQGELPDEEPTPSDPASNAKPVIAFERQIAPLNNMDQDESSGEIIFETVIQKDYNYSPEKKKKKIHKQDAKPKPKEKEKPDISSKEKQRKIEKRKSPTPVLPQQEPPVPPQQQRDFHQQPPQPMPQSFYSPYMYMPPVNNMMPHMYPPQYPPLPYVHPGPYHYPGPMGPIPPGGPINHPHYAMPPPQMYPNYAPKPMMAMKPQPEGAKYQNYKAYQPDYMKNQTVYSQAAQQKYPPMKMEQPSNHPMHAPPSYHINNPQHNKNLPPPNLLPPINQTSGPSPRSMPPERPKQKERLQFQPIREKRYDYRTEIKKEVRQTLKELSVEQQQQLLEAIRCILKYHHLSFTLFPSQSAMKSNAYLSCYQKNLAKLQSLMSSDDSQRGKMIEHVLTSLQIKDPLLKLKERILYHKVITEGEHQLGHQLRLKLAQKGS